MVSNIPGEEGEDEDEDEDEDDDAGLKRMLLL